MICLASFAACRKPILDCEDFGFAWCSWEEDSGWRCHTEAACGLWPCHPKPRHFSILTHRISLVMCTRRHTHALDSLQTNVSVILSSPLSSIILGWLPPLGLHPYTHPLPNTSGVKTTLLLGLEGTQVFNVVNSRSNFLNCLWRCQYSEIHIKNCTLRSFSYLAVRNIARDSASFVCFFCGKRLDRKCCSTMQFKSLSDTKRL